MALLTRRTHMQLVVVGAALGLAAILAVIGQRADTLPSPFPNPSRLPGAIQVMGQPGRAGYVHVTFDSGEVSEPLAVESINLVSTPNDPNVSDGVPLSLAITPGMRVYGYKFSSYDAAAEQAVNERAIHGEDVSFRERFPGQFFASNGERSAGPKITNFEEEANIRFFPLSEVTLERNARYIIVTHDVGTTFRVRGVTGTSALITSQSSVSPLSSSSSFSSSHLDSSFPLSSLQSSSSSSRSLQGWSSLSSLSYPSSSHIDSSFPLSSVRSSSSSSSSLSSSRSSSSSSSISSFALFPGCPSGGFADPAIADPAPSVILTVTGSDLQALAYANDGDAYVLLQTQKSINDRPARLYEFPVDGSAPRVRPYDTLGGQAIAIAHALVVSDQYLSFALQNYARNDALYLVDRSSLTTALTVPFGAESIVRLWFDPADGRRLFVVAQSSLGYKLYQINAAQVYRPGEYPVGQGYGIELPSGGVTFDPVTRFVYALRVDTTGTRIVTVDTIRGIVDTVMLEASVSPRRLMAAKNGVLTIETPRGFVTVDAEDGHVMTTTVLEEYMMSVDSEAIEAGPGDRVTAATTDGSFIRMVLVDAAARGVRSTDHVLPARTRDFVRIATQSVGNGYIVAVRTPSPFLWEILRGVARCALPAASASSAIVSQARITSVGSSSRISSAPVATCGDGIVQAPEACDDGNPAAQDDCRADCTLSQCSLTQFGLVGSGFPCADLTFRGAYVGCSDGAQFYMWAPFNSCLSPTQLRANAEASCRSHRCY